MNEKQKEQAEFIGIMPLGTTSKSQKHYGIVFDPIQKPQNEICFLTIDWFLEKAAKHHFTESPKKMKDYVYDLLAKLQPERFDLAEPCAWWDVKDIFITVFYSNDDAEDKQPHTILSAERASDLPVSVRLN